MNYACVNYQYVLYVASLTSLHACLLHPKKSRAPSELGNVRGNDYVQMTTVRGEILVG